MSSNKSLSAIDKLVLNLDRVVRTLSSQSISPVRKTPGSKATNSPTTQAYKLNETEKKHIGGLMRINHTGEVCAQALYQGQALTARDEKTRDSMQVSAIEEEDHLAWCEERLTELNSRPSYLNPLFYGLSFGIGTLAGLAGDKWSLGFIAATEDQVCKHLRDHLTQIPEHDKKSRAILTQMLSDEEHHGQKALEEGGVEFSEGNKKIMTAISTVMTKATYTL